jgi:hypothetical protein
LFRLFILFLGSFSLIYAQKSEKPKATEVTKGISVTFQIGFTVMTDDDIAQKYPTYKKPLAMYQANDKTADFGINFAVNRWNNRNLEVLKDMYRSTLLAVFTNVEFQKEGTIEKINGRDFILFEFISELKSENSIDERTFSIKKYTYLAYTLYEKHILIFNFTCENKDKNPWIAKANEIIHSVKITDKLKIVDFVPIESSGPKPKTEDFQMKMIKKLRKKH